MLDTVELARVKGYHCFMSHRSGETEDAFLRSLTARPVRTLDIGAMVALAPCLDAPPRYRHFTILDNAETGLESIGGRISDSQVSHFAFHLKADPGTPPQWPDTPSLNPWHLLAGCKLPLPLWRLSARP
jgi:hypothetical protein